MELHSNNTSREAKPGITIPGIITFHGKSVVFLVIGVGLFIFMFLALYLIGLDWYFALPISLVPITSLTAFVALFINDRPPSYITDLLYMRIWRLKTWLYMAGVKDKPSELWIADGAPSYPKDF